MQIVQIQPLSENLLNQVLSYCPIGFHYVNYVAFVHSSNIKIEWNKCEEHAIKKYIFSQAHDKSVNCGCFDGYDTDKFVTGGDDSCINIWQVLKRKEGFYVRYVLHHTWHYGTYSLCSRSFSSTSPTFPGEEILDFLPSCTSFLLLSPNFCTTFNLLFIVFVIIVGIDGAYLSFHCVYVNRCVLYLC